MRILRTLRTVTLSLLVLVAVATSAAAAPAPKPEKIPVAFGAWTGAGAGSFKSAMRNGLKKDCQFVAAKNARVLIEGEVKPAATGKGVTVRLIIKAKKTGEVIESKEFQSPKPNASQGLGSRMARAAVDMARRVPTE